MSNEAIQNIEPGNQSWAARHQVGKHWNITCADQIWNIVSLETQLNFSLMNMFPYSKPKAIQTLKCSNIYFQLSFDFIYKQIFNYLVNFLSSLKCFMQSLSFRFNSVVMYWGVEILLYASTYAAIKSNT